MARTRASVGAKLSSGKSSKAKPSAPPPPPPPAQRSSSSGSTDKSRSSGGNPVCPRETPKWQKPITNFFISKETNVEKGEDECDVEDVPVAGNSKTKRNIIESDSEEEVDKPKNQVLDETIELEPLNGDNSHKIEEYYIKNKGKGKRSKGKENRVTEKRTREDDDGVQSGKRVKISVD